MLRTLNVMVIFLAFISHQDEAIAQSEPPYHSYFLPLEKHSDDVPYPLFTIQTTTADSSNYEFVHSNFLIDIDAPLTWHDCIVQWNTLPDHCPEGALCTFPVTCEEYQCADVRTSFSYKSPDCGQISDSKSNGYCTCPVNVADPFNKACGQALLNFGTFFVSASDGRNPFNSFYAASFNAACAPSSTFQTFPANITGIMALSSSPYALPASLNRPPLKGTFALCFPSTSADPGILFIGNGPYYLLPQLDVDVRSLLSYSPLLKHPSSFGYFIGVNSILIKQRSVDLPLNTTAKLSTIEPYTLLRTDIYNSVTRRFSKVTKRIPKANPIKPFSLCFSISRNGTQAGLKFPDIYFNLQGGMNWTISSENSIKQITEDVACMAFVDGGSTSEHAIVIGTYQIEDNFLLFDLENSSFGFSSSLLRKQTSCANFNFTMLN